MIIGAKYTNNMNMWRSKLLSNPPNNVYKKSHVFRQTIIDTFSTILHSNPPKPTFWHKFNNKINNFPVVCPKLYVVRSSSAENFFPDKLTYYCVSNPSTFYLWHIVILARNPPPTSLNAELFYTFFPKITINGLTYWLNCCILLHWIP